MRKKIIEILEQQEKTYFYEPDATQRYLISIYDNQIDKIADQILEVTNDCAETAFTLNKIKAWYISQYGDTIEGIEGVDDVCDLLWCYEKVREEIYKY